MQSTAAILELQKCPVSCYTCLWLKPRFASNTVWLLMRNVSASMIYMHMRPTATRALQFPNYNISLFTLHITFFSPDKKVMQDTVASRIVKKSANKNIQNCKTP